MAERTVTVQPSGGDYTTLAAAVSGEITANADLTTDNGSGAAGPLIIEISGSWASADSAAVSIDGFTTSGANYLEIRTDSANRALKTDWDDTRYRLVVTTDTAITNTDAYVRLTGLQVQCTGSTPDFVLFLAYWDSDTPNDIRVDSCRIVGDGTTNSIVGMWAYDSGSSPVITIQNSIFDACNPSIKQSDGTLNIWQCVLYGVDSGDRGIWAFSDIQVVDIQNTAIFHCGDAYYEDGGTPASVTIDHCATDDADGTNAVAPINSTWSDEFDGPATGDFTLKDTGNLHEGGTAITGGPSTDIEGDSWGSPPSIGADEYTSSADALTGDDIATGAVAVETPSIGQVHALVRTDISTGVVVVEEGALGQTHALVGSDVSLGALVVGTPTAGEVINGTVEYNGSACNGATVDVIDDSSGTLVETATTNVSGEYTLTLNAGTYRVSWTWYDSGGSSWKGKASVIVYGS